MASTHLTPTDQQHQHSISRLILILAVIGILIALTAARVAARVTEAESGDHIKPMPVAQYEKLKAQIRAHKKFFYVAPKAELIRWKTNTSSGWVSPWPK